MPFPQEPLKVFKSKWKYLFPITNLSTVYMDCKPHKERLLGGHLHLVPVVNGVING